MSPHQVFASSVKSESCSFGNPFGLFPFLITRFNKKFFMVVIDGSYFLVFAEVNTGAVRTKSLGFTKRENG